MKPGDIKRVTKIEAAAVQSAIPATDWIRSQLTALAKERSLLRGLLRLAMRRDHYAAVARTETDR